MKYIIQFITTVVILLIISSLVYLVKPEYPDYEFFSYSFFGGLLVYFIFYIIISLSRIILKKTLNTMLSLIISFVILESLLFLITESNLVNSIIQQQKGEVIFIYFLYNLIPLISFVSYAFFNKKKAK